MWQRQGHGQGELCCQHQQLVTVRAAAPAFPAVMLPALTGVCSRCSASVEVLRS